MSGVIPGPVASSAPVLAFCFINISGLVPTRENRNITSVQNTGTGTWIITVTAAGFLLIPVVQLTTDALNRFAYQDAGGQSNTIVTVTTVTEAGIPVNTPFNFLAIGRPA